MEPASRWHRSSASPRHEARQAAAAPWLKRWSDRRHLPYRARVEAEREIRQAFQTFDADGTGSVDYHELKAAMRALGLPVKKAEVLAAMRGQGCLDTGRIGFHAFSAILMERFEQQDPLQAMLNSFHLFDAEGRGKISLQDLERVMRDLGEHFPHGDLRAMVDCFDRNKDGEIDEEEFVRVMAATSLR